MSVITASDTTIFKDSSIMISNVNRFLKSYATLYQPEEFYRYIKEIISQLGIGVYKESQAISPVSNYKAKLPDNFAVLYSAYKVTPSFSHKDKIHFQESSSWVMKNEVTSELIVESGGCEIDCSLKNQEVIEKFTVKNYVREGNDMDFTYPILLRLSPNVKRGIRTDDSPCIGASSPLEISIDNGFLYTNFSEDNVYIKYYGLPIDDESGLPMIPNINSVEKAIEWYIIYQVLLGLWFNSEVSDLQTKVQKAEIEYRYWFAQALYEAKLPSFQTMINKALLNRKSLSVYRQIDHS